MAEGNKAENLNKEMENLREDLKKIQDDLRELAQTIVDVGRDSARTARENVEQQWKAQAEQFQKYVEERPMAVVMGALVVGLVAGILFRR